MAATGIGNAGRSRAGKTIAYALLAYSVAVTLLLALRIVVSEQWLVIAYLNHGIMWMLVLALPGALLCPLILRWRGVVAVVPAVVFLAFYIPQFVAKPQNDLGLSVATYNATGGLDTPNKLALVRALDVDILGIQEVADQNLILAQMRDIYPYGVAQFDINTTEVRYDHFALFSRYPIDEGSLVYIGEDQANIRPAAMRLTVDVAGQPVSVYVMHTVRPNVNPFDFSIALRHSGVLSLIDAVASETNPVIVLCDCNMSEWTEDYSLMSAVLTDTWRERGIGFGLTVPATRHRAPFPLMRGDYIWHSDQVTAQAAEVWSDSADSEHFPIRAVLSFRQGQ